MKAKHTQSTKGVVTIKRSQWTARSFYNSNRYCAIGFALKSAGFADHVIECGEINVDGGAEKLVNAGLEKLVCPVPGTERLQWSDVVSDIVSANDDEASRGLTPEREQKLAKAFAKAGVKVVFES